MIRKCVIPNNTLKNAASMHKCTSIRNTFKNACVHALKTTMQHKYNCTIHTPKCTKIYQPNTHFKMLACTKNNNACTIHLNAQMHLYHKPNERTIAMKVPLVFENQPYCALCMDFFSFAVPWYYRRFLRVKLIFVMYRTTDFNSNHNLKS